jgi:hypothetical protein
MELRVTKSFTRKIEKKNLLWIGKRSFEWFHEKTIMHDYEFRGPEKMHSKAFVLYVANGPYNKYSFGVFEFSLDCNFESE